jgi:hypothetical protein
VQAGRCVGPGILEFGDGELRDRLGVPWPVQDRKWQWPPEQGVVDIAGDALCPWEHRAGGEPIQQGVS